MQDWIDYVITLGWTRIGVAAGILLMGVILARVLSRYGAAVIRHRWLAHPTISSWSYAFEKPVRALIIVLSLYLAIYTLSDSSWAGLRILGKLFRSTGVILMSWGFYRLSASSSLLLESISRRIGLDESSMLIPFLSKTIRVVMIIISVTVVGAEWGFQFNGLIAGMGLGSLAVALAAKETLSNILAGIVIITEKPFSKGDWIMTPSVEGIVEDITFRSSRIRTFADSLVTVPNATIADQPITNWSKMGKRRINFTLHVELKTDPVRLQTAVERLEAALQDDPRVAPGLLMVRFNEFRESGLGIFFYFFTNTTVWAEHLTARQELNFMIMRILDEEGVRLAYPAQRILIEEEKAFVGSAV
ncbi:mechanosensitive ion channel family protein [Paenibacillus sp. JX-17]|uniref:Mechanosensitive ion channel family protein n=1 Tax=Paenibacillus lacisoli TaxID=3064525 RepID=A0ABT9C832_9BACL|nr:mechanosensitive ion channel family protein [Paenibacillus sp. JX-17]MDO7904839.1 mechanosensitive ion channel family protein [Paenibacillus sp. JX-17]